MPFASLVPDARHACACLRVFAVQGNDDIHAGCAALGEHIARQQTRLLSHGDRHVHRTSRVSATNVIDVYDRRMLEIG